MKSIKRFISSIIVLLVLTSSAYADRLAIPSGSLPWSTLRDTYLNVMTAELYTHLGATEGKLPATPTFDGMIIRGSGNSWIQVYNNTAWTDTLTGLGGFGILDWHPYTVLNGTPARLALYSELGDAAPPTIQSADPTIASSTGWYLATTSGDAFYVTQGVGVFTIPGSYAGDDTDPVIGTITPSALTHDGTGASLSATVASVTETNEDDREWSLYDVTDDAIEIDWSVFTGLSIATILIPADQHTYRVDVRCTDLAGNVGTASSANIVYDAGGCESDIVVIGQDSIEGGTVGNSEEFGNYIHWSRYVASDTCTIDRLHTRLQNSGSTAYNVRMAIFSSSAGEPSSQLGITPETATAGSGAAQDLSCTLSTSVEVVSGTTYWIAEWMSTTATGRYYFEYLDATTAEAGYQAAAYSSTGDFPTPARTAWNNKFIFYGVTE